jgi:hypothetical protein
MIYEVQFCNAWIGTWKFEAADDVVAYNKVWKMIKDHTRVVIVGIDSIYELDQNGNKIRILPKYEDCVKTSVRAERKKREKRLTAIYIAHFIDGTRSVPFEANTSPGNIIAENTAKQKFNKKIVEVEELLQYEKAIYKAYFSDGTCSGPFIAEIKENDIIAKEIVEQKLKQHIEYNKIDSQNIKIDKIEELNEDNNFIVNTDRLERNKRRVNKMRKRKNRFILSEG